MVNYSDEVSFDQLIIKKILVLSIISQLRSKRFNNLLILNISIFFFISFPFLTIFNDNLNFEEKIVFKRGL